MTDSTSSILARKAELATKKAKLEEELALIEKETQELEQSQIREALNEQKLNEQKLNEQMLNDQKKKEASMWLNKAIEKMQWDMQVKEIVVGKSNKGNCLFVSAPDLHEFKTMKGTMEEKMSYFRASLTKDVFAQIKEKLDGLKVRGQKVEILNLDMEKVGFDIRMSISSQAESLWLLSSENKSMKLLFFGDREPNPIADCLNCARNGDVKAEAKMASIPFDDKLSVAEKALYWFNMINYQIRVQLQSRLKDQEVKDHVKDEVIVICATDLDVFKAEAGSNEDKRAKWFISDELFALIKSDIEFFNSKFWSMELVDFVPKDIKFSVRISADVEV